MAISLVNVTNTGTAAGATAITSNVPASVANGDLLIWAISTTNGGPVTPQAGWSRLVGGTSGASTLSIDYRIAASEPASYTTTTGTSGRWAAAMAAYRGVDNGTPFDVSTPAMTVGTTALTFPAITPVTAGAWVIPIAHLFCNTSGVTSITWTTGNITAVDSGAGGTATGATNSFVAHGHFAWTSGAFTPTAPTSSTSSWQRTLGMSAAIRPAVSGQTGNINRITTTGVGRSLTASPGGATASVGRITTSATARSLSGTPGAVTRAVARLTVAGTPRQLVASAIGPSSAAITRLLASSALRLVTAVSPTATIPEPVGTWTEVAPRSFEEPDPADWIEPPAAFWTEPDPADYIEEAP